MLLEPRLVKLSTRTGVEVRRSIPNIRKRTIGAWCFVDHFGPTTQTDGMVVAAHPHTGLQTVSWLFEGAIEHRDSLGTSQQVSPGQLNIMTAGNGISHSELSQVGPAALHAVQLWIALPDSVRHMPPEFQHISDLPTFSVAGLSGPGLSGKVLVGTLLGAHSPARVHSELVGAELRMPVGADAVTLALRPDWEYGVLVVQGSARINGASVAVSNLEYLAPGQTEMTLESTDPNEPLVAILLGGKPFEERLVMWWNFIERSHAEIVRVRQEWNERESLGQNGSRFGDFVDNVGGWIPAPDLPNVELKSR